MLALVITHIADIKLRNILQDRIIDRISKAPLAWFSSSSTGRVRKAIQDDTVQIHMLVAHAPVEQTAAVGVPLVLLVYAFVVDWRLGFLSIATFPIYALLQWVTMRDMATKTAEMDDKLADISSSSIELTEGIHVVKNVGQTGKAHRRFTRACEEFARFYWDWCGPLIKASALSLSVISVAALMAINLRFGLLMAKAGWVGVTDVPTCSLIALVLPRTIEVLGNMAWGYQQAGNAALRLQDVLSIEQISHPQVSVRIPDDMTVTFDDVSSSYLTPDGVIPALSHVNLTLRPGTVTALVGPSGSGKSTLATMLARFRDPDSGVVRIGGVDLKDVAQNDLYRLVSFVLQDPYMQRRSIRDVITLARPDATDDQVREAARAAHILDDIDALPKGFDTVLGDDTDFLGWSETAVVHCSRRARRRPDPRARRGDGRHRSGLRGGDPAGPGRTGPRPNRARHRSPRRVGGRSRRHLRHGERWHRSLRFVRGIGRSALLGASVGRASDGRSHPMTTTMNSRLSWAGDILLLNTFRPLLTEEGAAKFRRSLWLAGLQGTLEGVGLFAVIPTITAFVEGGSSMGLTWQGWVWVLAALAVAGAVVTYFQSTIGYLAAMDVMGKLSVRIGDQVASLPLGWFRSSFLGRLSRLLIQGLMHLGEGLAHFTAPLVRGAATTVVMMVLSWFWSWQLGLSLLISMPAMCLIMIASRALWLRGESVVQPTEQELAARIVEFCETQPVLRAAGRAEGYEPLRNARRANERAARKCLGLGVTANFLSGLGAQAVAVVLIVLAARMGSNGTLAPVATVAFVGVSLRYAKVLEDVVSAALSVETARKPVSEVDEILSAEVLPEPEAPSDMTAPGEVSLEDVSFGYDKEHPVVHDVTFTAPAGGLTAIVGPSGAGKTTLFRLMARFWGVDLGTVRVGGLDVRDQTTEQLMSQLAMVFQDVYLYDSTLAENIRIGAPDATDEQVWKAGSLAGVDEIAARLPGGWDASVGEGGRRLSGGERQRVPVARALLKRAPILLFDEATSALDPEDEAHVEAALAQLRESSTILVIAHKLDTIRSADRIVVIDRNGRVCQVGTHDDLIASGGVYADLWHARERAEGWSLVGRE